MSDPIEDEDDELPTWPTVWTSLSYTNGEVHVEDHRSAQWARILDSYRIRWTYHQTEDKNPYFDLVETNALLEVVGFDGVSHIIACDAGDRDGATPIVIVTKAFWNFHFRDPLVANQRDLLAYCPDCDKAFFTPSIDLTCGFCNSPKPRILEQSRISGFGFADIPVSFEKDLREEIEQAQKSTPSRERLLTEAATNTGETCLFDEAFAEKASARESSNWSALRQALSGPAFLHQWPSIEKIEALNRDYPNFGEVCAFIVRRIGLSWHQPSRAVGLPNLLLVGRASCGKSSFAERLAEVLVGNDYTRIDLGQAGTNFALVGSDSGFNRGKEGRILRLMAGELTTKPVANPVVILDELDKALDESRFSPLPALLSLLNKRDARKFTDEFFTVPIDASRISFLALANTIQPLSEPLLSRFKVFFIEDYSDEEFVNVVIPSIYRDWCTTAYPGAFPLELSSHTRAEIAQASGYVSRQVATVLEQMAFEGHPQLSPAPVWEGLRHYPTGENPIAKGRSHG